MTNTLEEKRERLGAILSGTDSHELKKSGIPVMDEMLAKLVQEKGKAFTTLVLLSLKSRLSLSLDKEAGATEEELDASANLQSLILMTLAKETEYDIDDILNTAEKLAEDSSLAVRDEEAKGDPNGVIAKARKILEERKS